MSIYLAQSVSEKATHPLFAQREIKGMTPGKASLLNVFGQPLLPQSAYSGYTSNIDIFTAATARQMKLNVTVAGALVDPKSTRPVIPMVYPALAFSLTKALPSDKEEAWCGKLIKWGPEKKRGNKETLYIFHNPDADFYHRVSQIANMGGPRSSSYVYPKTFQEIIMLQRLISEFLATNTYPAYSTDTKTTEMLAGLMEIHIKRKVSAMKNDIERMDKFVRSTKKPRVEEADVEMDPVKEEEETLKEIESKLMTLNIHPVDVVTIAKPSPVPVTFNFGEPSQVPGGLPGRVFPYFPGMLQADAAFLKTSVRTLFLRCFGDSREAWEKRYSQARNNFEDLAPTVIGGIFAHILLGIKLALDTHTRLFVVYQTGEYAGFVLLGGAWRIHLHEGEWVGPEDSASLHKTVAKMSTHGLALTKICEALSDMEIDEKGMMATEAVEVGSIKNARVLAREINRRKFKSQEEREAVGDWTAQLAFERSYLPVTVETLTWAIEHLTTKESQPIDESVPLFIGSDVTSLRNRYFLVLGAFGPDAPSFVNASGNLFTIFPPNVDDPNEKEASGKKGQKVMPAILVATKGLVIAVADMRKMIAEKVMMMDFGERAGKHRCRRYESKDRDALYGILKECIGRKKETVVLEDDSVAAGKKRKDRDGGDGKDVDPMTAFDDLF